MIAETPVAGCGAIPGRGSRLLAPTGSPAARRRAARGVVLALPVILAVAGMAACGGKLRSPTEPQAAPATGPAMTFTQIQAGIFTPRCAKSGCHVTGTATGGLVLEAGLAYANIVGRPALEAPLAYVRPGSPDASYLLKKVRGDADIVGSRMPFDGPPFLNPHQIAGLAAWIQAGAPNT
jgi:hypothetical protein